MAFLEGIVCKIGHLVVESVRINPVIPSRPGTVKEAGALLFDYPRLLFGYGSPDNVRPAVGISRNLAEYLGITRS